MKKILLSLILMAASVGMAHASEPVLGIVCSYGGQEAFFPLSDSPQVKYENKEGVQHAVVLVGGVEKLSIALVDGGKLEVSYDKRSLHDHIFAEEWSNDENNHWHECTCQGEDCEGVDDYSQEEGSGYGSHSYGEVATESTYYICSECSYENATRKVEYQAAVDQAAADAVVTKIEAIGTVEYTDASKDLIDAAREAYDALTDDQLALLPAGLPQVLTDAEAAYAELKAAAEKAAADLAAANAVIAKINAIGTVEYTDDCKALIDAAREAYDALTDDQMALITAGQLQVLTDAEAGYEAARKALIAHATFDPTSGVCYGTYYADFAWTPATSDVHVFYVRSVVRTEGSGSDVKDCVQLQEIKGTVPANTGVILATFTEGDIQIQKSEEVAEPVSGNLLRGVTKAQTVEAQEGESLYKLSFNNTNSRIAFYWDVEGGESLAASANRAYLAVTGAPALVKAIGFDEALATSLRQIMAGAEDNTYNLQGQRVAPSTKGLYIKNGKKYLVK